MAKSGLSSIIEQLQAKNKFSPSSKEDLEKLYAIIEASTGNVLTKEEKKKIKKYLNKDSSTTSKSSSGKQSEQRIKESMQKAMAAEKGGVFKKLKAAHVAGKETRKQIREEKNVTIGGDLAREAGLPGIGFLADVLFGGKKKEPNKPEEPTPEKPKDKQTTESQENQKEQKVDDRKEQAQQNLAFLEKDMSRVMNVLDKISTDISYIVQRISPKQISAKARGKSDEERKDLIYDPLAPEDQRFTNAKGGMPIKDLGEYKQSAIMQVAYMGKQELKAYEESVANAPQLLETKQTATSSESAQGPQVPQVPEAKQTTTSPESAQDPLNPSQEQQTPITPTPTVEIPEKQIAAALETKIEDIKSDESSGEPKVIEASGETREEESLKKVIKQALTEFEEEKSKRFKDPTEDKKNDNLLQVLDSKDSPLKEMKDDMEGKNPEGGLGNLFNMLASSASLIGKVLGPVAGVGLAAFIGYEVGSWLNKTFKLDEKINNLLEKFGVNAYDPNRGQKTGEEMRQEFNTRESSGVRDLGLELVGAGEYKNVQTGQILKYDELSSEQKKAVDLHKFSKNDAELRKEAQALVDNNGSIQYINENGERILLGEKPTLFGKDEWERHKDQAIELYVKEQKASNLSNIKRIEEEYAAQEERAKQQDQAPGIVNSASGQTVATASATPSQDVSATPTTPQAVGAAAATPNTPSVESSPTAAPISPQSSETTPTGTPVEVDKQLEATPSPSPSIPTSTEPSKEQPSSGSDRIVDKKVSSNQGKRAVTAAMDRRGISDPVQRAAIAAQIAHESGGFVQLQENLKYREPRLKQVFGYYARNPEQAKEDAGDATAIANKAYSNMLGNSGPESGDGSKYSGKGFIQLTGKANYERFNVTNPKELLNPDKAAENAIDYMLRYKGDWSDVDSVTKYVNGRRKLGLEERKAYFESFKNDPEIITPNQTTATAETTTNSSESVAAATPDAATVPTAAPSGDATAAAAATTPAIPTAAPSTVAATQVSALPESRVSGTQLSAASTELANETQTTQPMVVNNIVAPPQKPSLPHMNQPSIQLPQATTRNDEGAFNRAMAKDYSHPTAFTTIGTV